MTTIAYRDGVLAGDSATSGDGNVIGRCAKVHRIRGRLVGLCGPIEDGETFRLWLKAGAKPKAKPDEPLDDDFLALVVEPDGRVVEYGRRLVSVGYEAPFYAIGSGGALALGAMAAGASAEEAVRIACRFDHYSREPVHALHLGAAAKASE